MENFSRLVLVVYLIPLKLLFFIPSELVLSEASVRASTFRLPHFTIFGSKVPDILSLETNTAQMLNDFHITVLPSLYINDGLYMTHVVLQPCIRETCFF